MSGTSGIQQQVAAAALTSGVPPQLALSVAQAESNYNPNATSSAGAQGVMQLMPATAKSLGVTDSYDPSQNIPAGVSFLGSLLNTYNGDQAAALAAYNWGPANVNKAQATYGSDWLSYAPASVQSYVNGILSSSASAAPITVDTSDDTSADSGDLFGLTDSGTSPWVIGGVAAIVLAGLWYALG